MANAECKPIMGVRGGEPRCRALHSGALSWGVQSPLQLKT